MSVEHLDEAPLAKADRSSDIAHRAAGASCPEHAQRRCHGGMALESMDIQAAYQESFQQSKPFLRRGRLA
jgi:hypothetical protein